VCTRTPGIALLPRRKARHRHRRALPRSAGGLHDFFSEADYWWPDPKNPDGPYIQRDGMSNPDNFVEHRRAMVRLSLIVPALAAAYKITRSRKYSDHAPCTCAPGSSTMPRA
jgi:hypothetical protein